MPERKGAADEDVWKEVSSLPRITDWPGLDSAERERRVHVLWDIATRIARDGPHRALASPERGRQFLPFAALRGLDELYVQAEEDAGRDPDDEDWGSACRGF